LPRCDKYYADPHQGGIRPRSKMYKGQRASSFAMAWARPVSLLTRFQSSNWPRATDMAKDVALMIVSRDGWTFSFLAYLCISDAAFFVIFLSKCPLSQSFMAQWKSRIACMLLSNSGQTELQSAPQMLVVHSWI